MSGERVPLDDVGYDRWKEEIIKICERKESHWKAEGGWLYPDADNGAFFGVLAHLCREKYEKRGVRGFPYNIDKCEACGEEPPAGIKMLALLERLP